MITFTADKFEIRAPDGTVMVSVGKIGGNSMVAYMFHFTRDGKYVDGVPITANVGVNKNFQKKLGNTYEGCHTWSFEGQWYSIAAAGLPYARWESELEANVPECVRIAEYLREKT